MLQKKLKKNPTTRSLFILSLVILKYEDISIEANYIITRQSLESIIKEKYLLFCLRRLNASIQLLIDCL